MNKKYKQISKIFKIKITLNLKYEEIDTLENY